MNVDSCSDVKQLRTYAHLLEADLRAVTKRLSEQAAEIAQLRGEEQANLELELQLLQEKLDRANKRLFGDSSERRTRDGDSDRNDRKDKKKQSGHGPRPQPELPLVEVVHDLDEADRICPTCGGHLRDWKGQFEESDEIDVLELVYRIVRHKRQKCRCDNCRHVEAALGPDKLIPGGRYSLRFAVSVAVSKYGDHQPLARQVQQMARQGLVVTTQALWDQIHALAGKLDQTYRALVAYVLTASVICVDETTWRLLSSKTKKKWWAWAAVGNEAVFYQILPSRSADAAREVLRQYRGTVMADGMGAYSSLEKSAANSVRDGPRFGLAQCWAHSRRKLVDAESAYPEAQVGIELIGRLYAVERKADEATAELPDEDDRVRLREEVRQRESAPVLNELRQWMTTQRALPRSAFGKAIAYIDKRWRGLTMFLTDGRIPLDSNRVERAMRGPVLGRKNHYGSQSRRGTEASAVLYSFVETCKLVGVDPAAYLREAALRALDTPASVLLPHEYQAELAAGANETTTSEPA